MPAAPGPGARWPSRPLTGFHRGARRSGQPDQLPAEEKAGGSDRAQHGGSLARDDPHPGEPVAMAACGSRPGGRRSGVGRASMQVMASRSLVVKVTAGMDDPERCNQAFTVAAAAAASGVPVSLWLTGEAAWFALPGRAEALALPYATPLAELLATIMKSGTVSLCTQCASRREITADDTIQGVRIAGAAAFVAEIMAEGAQALVY